MDVVIHTYNPLIQESKTGGLSGVWGQLDYIVNLRSAQAIYSETPFSACHPQKTFKENINSLQPISGPIIDQKWSSNKHS